MSEEMIPVPASWAANARVNAERRAADHARSLADSDAYWLEQAARLDWITAPTKTDESSFDADDFAIRWFADGRLNVSMNCVDRHLAERGHAIAIIWEPDDPATEARASHLSRTARGGVPLRQCAESRMVPQRATASPSICR